MPVISRIALIAKDLAIWTMFLQNNKIDLRHNKRIYYI